MGIEKEASEYLQEWKNTLSFSYFLEIWAGSGLVWWSETSVSRYSKQFTFWCSCLPWFKFCLVFLCRTLKFDNLACWKSSFPLFQHIKWRCEYRVDYLNLWIYVVQQFLQNPSTTAFECELISSYKIWTMPGWIDWMLLNS
jgi:hypothetical protein